jgi:hypothetical protein
MPDYPTAPELVAESNIPALTQLTPDQQQELYELSVSAIEEFCGQVFDFQQDATFLLDGPGSNVMYLPKRLERLDALYITNSALDVGDVTLSEKHDHLEVISGLGAGRNYYSWALLSFEVGVTFDFAYGLSNVQITGNWGWENFPTPVRTAIRTDMEDTALADTNLLNQTVRSYRKMGMRDISQGNLRAAVNFAPGLGDDVINMLQPYVWQGAIGVVV